MAYEKNQKLLGGKATLGLRKYHHHHYYLQERNNKSLFCFFFSNAKHVYIIATISTSLMLKPIKCS